MLHGFHFSHAVMISSRITPISLAVVGHLTLWSLLGIDGSLLSHGSEDDDICHNVLAMNEKH
jgi:hypothetical protein